MKLSKLTEKRQRHVIGTCDVSSTDHHLRLQVGRVTATTYIVFDTASQPALLPVVLLNVIAGLPRVLL